MPVQLHERPSEPAAPPMTDSDPAADPHLLQPHEADLLRYARHLLGQTPGAADVVQDTFARFWAQADDTRQRLCETNAHPGRDPHSRLRAWLFTVCRNRALDVRKKERRMTPLTAPVSAVQTHPAPGPDQQAEQRDTHAAVLRRLADLPDAQQEVIRLKFQAGLSYKQIAEVTGLTVSGVGVHLHHALKTLRQQMNPAN